MATNFSKLEKEAKKLIPKPHQTSKTSFSLLLYLTLTHLSLILFSIFQTLPYKFATIYTTQPNVVLLKMSVKLKHRIDPQTTHPLIWLLATVCAIIAVAVIIGGIVIFVGYLVIHPRIPFVRVVYAHLDSFEYDSYGILQTAFTIIIRAENDNLKAHATFYDMGYDLSLKGMKIARLQSKPFDVQKNNTHDLPYVFHSNPIPLDRELRKFVDYELKRNEMSFMLIGGGRARWKVGPLGSIKFWCEMDCELKFRRNNGTYIGHHCTSKAR